MKKLLALVLTVIMLFSLSTVAFAVDYEQIFPENLLGSATYRIPALYTLNDGSVIAAADMRYGHGSDSPNNIETLIAKSADGYTGWSYQTINYFDDYADGVTATASASFIDTAIVQSSTGRIFAVADAQPANCGYLQCKQGTGFTTIDGVKYMLLTKGNNTDSLDSFKYYIGEYVDGMAPVLNLEDSSATSYSVDAEYNLYQNGTPLTMAQRGSEGVTVQQNVFYDDAVLKCYCTTYLWMRYSDDNGATWSDPVNLTAQVKNDNEYFLGICPGRGFVTTLPDGTERIIFTVYDNGGIIGWNAVENVSTIYSDDNGATWNRGADTFPKMGVGKTSESQIVELNNGVLRMFSRNSSDHIAYADSRDGGITWDDFGIDDNLGAHGNCMCSFINTSKTINGKKVVLGSFASNSTAREDGVVKVGLVNSNNTIEWISTYNVKSGFYAYSCLTELSDGNFGLLYEDAAAHISYMVLSVSDDGTVGEINNNNAEIEEKEQTIWEKIVSFFKNIIVMIQKFFGMA